MRWLLPFCVSLEPLRQIGWNMGDDYGIVAFIAQFQHVTDSMDLRDQRRFIRRNTKARAQSPRTQRILESLHEFVNSFSRARGDCDAAGKSLQVRFDQFTVWQFVDLV